MLPQYQYVSLNRDEEPDCLETLPVEAIPGILVEVVPSFVNLVIPYGDGYRGIVCHLEASLDQYIRTAEGNIIHNKVPKGNDSGIDLESLTFDCGYIKDIGAVNCHILSQ